MACVDWRHLEAFHGRVHKVAVCGPWYEQVVWATSEDPMKREEFTEQELRQSGYLTERFTEQTWLNPAIQHLQRVGDSCTLIGSIIKYTFSPIALSLFPSFCAPETRKAPKVGAFAGGVLLADDRGRAAVAAVERA